MRRRLAVAGILILASLADLPVVYRIVAHDHVAPVVALAFGFVAMGLAWAAGFRIEGGRAWFVLLASAVGAAQLVAAFVPALPVDALRPWALVSGALSALGLVAAAAFRAD